MPKVIKKKIAKPAKTEEGVQNFIHNAKEYLLAKKRALFPAVIAVIIVCLGAAAFSLHRSNMQKEASAFELEGYNLYYGLYQKQPSAQDEHYQKALEKFMKAYDKWRTPLSLFYVACCYYDLGKYDDAMKSLKELNERFPDEETFAPLSFYKMAVIDIKKGDNEAALKQLDVLYNHSAGSFKDLALMESARILETMGKKDESAKKYEELTKNFPDSPFAEQAKAKLTEKKS